MTSTRPLVASPHGAYQLGEGQALSSLARWPSNEGSRARSGVAHHTQHARCAPVRRATATVARLTPRDSVACAIVSTRARSPRNENRAAIFFSTTTPTQSHRHLRPGVWSPDISVEKQRVGKASAALRRDGRGSRRRETGDHLPGRRSVRLRRRCRGEDAQLSCASGSSGQRGPTARCLMWPGWLNGVRCWARAQLHAAC